MRIYGAGMVKWDVSVAWSQSLLFVDDHLCLPDGDRDLTLRGERGGERPTIPICPRLALSTASAEIPAPWEPFYPGRRQLATLS